MSTLLEKIAHADDTKWLLKRLVVDMGGRVPQGTSLRDYIARLAETAGKTMPSMGTWNPLFRESLYEEWNAVDLAGTTAAPTNDQTVISTWKGRNGLPFLWDGTGTGPKFWRASSNAGFPSLQFSGGTMKTDEDRVATDEMTTFTLIKLNATTSGQNVIAHNTVSANRSWTLSTAADNKIALTSFRLSNAGVAATSSKVMDTNQWLLVVGTRNADTVTCSIAGEGKVSATLPDVKKTADKLRMGLYFNGYVSLHRQYNKVLTDSQIHDVCEEIMATSTALAWPTFPDNLTPVATDMPMIGLNLSGAEFDSKPTGGFPPLSDMQFHKAKGLQMFRMPFRMERVRKDGAFIATELAALKQSLDDAATVGLKVILDPHDGFKIGSPPVENTAAQLLSDTLALLAEIHDKPALWLWELNNEPTTANRHWYNDVVPVLVAGIHNVYPDMRIGIQGDSYSSVTRWPSATGITTIMVGNPDKLYYGAHLYVDENQSGTWGKGSADKLDRYQTISLTRGRDMAASWVKWLQMNGLRGYIGEFGGPYDNPSFVAAMEDFYDFAADNNIPIFYWSGGIHWPSNDANALQYHDAEGQKVRPTYDILMAHNSPAT